jgi:glycosyltransferase involved in cell wall biosynthesis
VIIPCFEQGRFLASAIESALGQTVRPAEIIVVDDGSTQRLDTSAYPQVKLLRRPHAGPSAARNSGLQAASSDRVVFLDADDLLLPDAIAAGLDCFERNPGSAFVYGAFIEVRPGSERRSFSRASTYTDLLRCNWIGMIGTVMFDCEKLVQAGGFDESLRMCEDWELFLRLSRDFPFASHDRVVAKYVKHGANSAADSPDLRKWVDIVRSREWDRGLDPAAQAAWREGRACWDEALAPAGERRRRVGGIARAAARRLAALLRR